MHMHLFFMPILLVLFKKLSKQLPGVCVNIYECIKTGWSWPFLDQLLIFNG